MRKNFFDNLLDYMAIREFANAAAWHSMRAGIVRNPDARQQHLDVMDKTLRGIMGILPNFNAIEEGSFDFDRSNTFHSHVCEAVHRRAKRFKDQSLRYDLNVFVPYETLVLATEQEVIDAIKTVEREHDDALEKLRARK